MQNCVLRGQFCGPKTRPQCGPKMGPHQPSIMTFSYKAPSAGRIRGRNATPFWALNLARVGSIPGLRLDTDLGISQRRHGPKIKAIGCFIRSRELHSDWVWVAAGPATWGSYSWPILRLHISQRRHQPSVTVPARRNGSRIAVRFWGLFVGQLFGYKRTM